MPALRDDHRMIDHGERTLAPLIEYDPAHNGELLRVIGDAHSNSGDRTATASAPHLSRSAFPQRLALRQDLIGVDLEDGGARPLCTWRHW